MGTPIHGKNALIYLAPGSGAAIAVSEQNTYSIESDFDMADTTELGDTWSTGVKGIMKWSGKMDGNFDTASRTLWLAHVGTAAVNFYLYPNRSSMTLYYYGTCWVKLGGVIAGGTTDKAKASVTLIGEGELSINA